MAERRGAPPAVLAASITRDASMQSYLTIRWLADRLYRADAFALYAYFRWLDDTIDEHLVDREQRLAFVERQRRLITHGTDGGTPAETSPEEGILLSLLDGGGSTGAARAEGHVRTDGLLLSLRSMLDVMEFDARRRGSAVPQHELEDYTHDLAVAVTEALHHCIGHGERSPNDATRYVAVTGAHVAHMLRDLAEDLELGYVNVPAELLTDGRVCFEDLHTPALRGWVRDRVELARSCFATGRRYLAAVENPRCRLAGHAYIARFEWVLDAVERDGYQLRRGYPERGTWRGGLTIAADGARSAHAAVRSGPAARARSRESVR